MQDEDINGGNTDNNAEVQDDVQEQQQPQAGPSGAGGGGGGPAGDNIPNALTYSSRKKSNKRQHEREEFRNKLLETLRNDGDKEEQDATDLAMLALVKKMKRNLNGDQQEELIEELQQVVGRFCHDVKHLQNRSVPPSTVGQVVQQRQEMLMQPYNAVSQLDGTDLADLQTVTFSSI